MCNYSLYHFPNRNVLSNAIIPTQNIIQHITVTVMKFSIDFVHKFAIYST